MSSSRSSLTTTNESFKNTKKSYETQETNGNKQNAVHVSKLGPRPVYFKTTTSEIMFVMTAIISQIINQAGALQTLTMFKILSEDLNTDSKMESWLMASFSLVTGSLILITGQLGDIYGLKKILMYGYAITFVWSLILGFTRYTHNASFFIVSRAFQGLGVSCILPNVMGIVGNIYQAGSHRKNLVFSLVGAGAPVGAVLGVWWASFIVHFDVNAWSWCFWAYGILCFIILVLNHIFCPNGIPKNTKNIKMDWIGACLAVVGLILFNFAWNQGAIVGFQTGYVIALLVISCVAIVLFFVYEKDYAKYPIVPKSVFMNANVVFILASLLFGWGSFGCYLFYLFQRRMNIEDMDPLLAGTEFVSFAVFGVFAALTVALTIKKLTPQVLLVISTIAFCGGSIMFVCTPLHQLYWKLSFFSTLVLVFGMDFSFPAASIVLSDNLPIANQGMAGSLVSTMVNYAMSVFLGVAGVVETQTKKRISSKHPEYSEKRKTFLGYKAAMYFAIGIAGLSIVISSAYALKTLVLQKQKNAGSQEVLDFEANTSESNTSKASTC